MPSSVLVPRESEALHVSKCDPRSGSVRYIRWLAEPALKPYHTVSSPIPAQIRALGTCQI